MTRPTLLSDRPRSSEVPSEPAPASHIEETSDFGRWLTRDLRTKGTPSLLPSELPPELLPPSAGERPAPSVVVAAPEEPPLASWLLSGLKPRGSVPPERASVSPAEGATNALSEAQTPQAAPAAAPLIPTQPEVGEAANPSADSLMPHAVSEPPRAYGAGAALAPSGDALDEDDLAVLPSRRRARGQRRWRPAALAALLLGSLALLLWRRTGSQLETARADAAASAPAAAEALPPPPPAQEEVVPPREEPEAAPAPRASGAPTPAGPDLPEPPDLPGRAGRRAGDAIARFADLPPPTLSKLAREERQKIREREARARAAKAALSRP
ncbi:MAG TPA: hypothetical protein VFS67_33845 [Polyangiaceae bacterium]|nr:hypothetical protein [Polyangiaceae bacterium]